MVGRLAAIAAALAVPVCGHSGTVVLPHGKGGSMTLKNNAPPAASSQCESGDYVCELIELHTSGMLTNQKLANMTSSIDTTWQRSMEIGVNLGVLSDRVQTEIEGNIELRAGVQRILKQVNETNQLANELKERDAAQSDRTDGVLGLLKSEMTRVNVTLERDAHKTVKEKARIEALKVEKAKWEVEREKLHKEEAREKLLERDKRELMKENRTRAMDKDRIDYETSQKEASALRLESKRRETEEALIRQRAAAELEKANVEIEVAIAKAKAEADGKTRQERENEDVRLRLEMEKGKAQRKRLLDAINLIFSRIADGGRDLLSNPERLVRTLAAVVLLAAGVYFVREFSKVVASEIGRRLGKPSLIRDTSRLHSSRSGGLFSWLAVFMLSLFKTILSVLSSLTSGSSDDDDDNDDDDDDDAEENTQTAKRGQNNRDFDQKRLSDISEFNDVILERVCEQRVLELAEATRNARNNRAPYRHLLFYGPAGTGKSMVAKRLALYSGMDWAIMSGGDVGPLGEQAVTDLHNLFSWARSSARGLMLFIDEAEAFLGSRARSAKNMTVHMRNALNALLFQTGDQSKHFMLVLATNRAADLDAAVLDRVDEAVHFGLPEFDQRLEIASEYFAEHILSRSPRIDTSCAIQAAMFARKTVDSLLCKKGALIFGSSLVPARQIELEGFHNLRLSTASGLFNACKNPNEDSDELEMAVDEEEEEEEEEENKGPKSRSSRTRGRRKRGPHIMALHDKIGRIECEDGTAKGIQACMHQVAEATEGFSGRQIAKMMISCQGMIYGTKRSALTPELLASLVQRKVDEHSRKIQMAAKQTGSSSRSTDNKFNYA
eukprot:g5034.t1